MFRKEYSLIKNHLAAALAEHPGDKFLETLHSYWYPMPEREFLNAHNALIELLWNEDRPYLAGVFAGPLAGSLLALLGDPWGTKFIKVWDSLGKHTYSEGFSRRPFRTATDQKIYLEKGIGILQDAVELVAAGFTYDGYFSGDPNAFQYNRALPNLLALELDAGNPVVQAGVRALVYENSGRLSRSVIRGMAMSCRPAVHKMLGDLLLAARLQEGLRQAIAETMDEGEPACFIYLLEVIIQNDLQRYSSIVRAVDVWTGLGLEPARPGPIKRCLQTIHGCLTDPSFRNRCLVSSDNLELYLGLWSLGFREITDCLKEITALPKTQEKHRVLTGLYFLSQAQVPQIQHELAARLIDYPDWEVKGWCLDNLFCDYSFASYTSFYQQKGADSLQALLGALKSFADSMPAKTMLFKESVFPWCNFKYSLDSVLIKLIDGVRLAPSNSNVDMVVSYRQRMSAEVRCKLINDLLGSPETDLQREALVQMIGDPSNRVRGLATDIVSRLNLRQQDFTFIESLFSRKSGDTMQHAITILLGQPPQMLFLSLGRLLESKEENKNLGALDILAVLKKEGRYPDLIAQSMALVHTSPHLSAQTKSLAEKLVQAAPDYSAAAGFGLYDPNKELDLPWPYQGFTYDKVFTRSAEELEIILCQFSRLVHEYRHHEFDSDSTRNKDKVILGSADAITALYRDKTGLEDTWKDEAKNLGLDGAAILQMLYTEQRAAEFQNFYQAKPSKAYEQLLSVFPPVDHSLAKVIEELPYRKAVLAIMTSLLFSFPREETFSLCCRILSRTCSSVSKELLAASHYAQPTLGPHPPTLVDSPSLLFWLQWLRRLVTDKTFPDHFALCHCLYRASYFNSSFVLSLEDWGRAWEMGLVDENELMRNYAPDHCLPTAFPF